MSLEGAIGIRGVVGFRDDVEVALAFQHAAVALANNRVIVDQQHRDACCCDLAHHGLTLRAGSLPRR
jgi:hypothetical protein